MRLQDTKLDHEMYKIVIIHPDLLPAPANMRPVECAFSQPTHVVYSAGNSRLPTSQLFFTRNAAVTWRVVGMVASVVCETKKLAARLAFVIGTTCVSLAIRMSSDEHLARPFA